MTGYGKAEIHYNGKKIIAEIKSLNSKALDLNTRIIPLHREHEMDIRRRIAAVLERGKVDFNLWTEADAEAATPRLNGAVVADYIQQIRQLSDAQGLPFPADHIWDIVARTDGRGMAGGCHGRRSGHRTPHGFPQSGGRGAEP